MIFQLPWRKIIESAARIDMVENFVANGCGPKLPGNIGKIQDGPFFVACVKHDFRFWRGGPEGYKLAAFYHANLEFAKDLKEACDDRELLEEDLQLATRMHAAVVVGGKPFFHWGKERNYTDLVNLLQ